MRVLDVSYLRRVVIVVCQTHFDGWRDAINRRLYRRFIRQLFLDRPLVEWNAIALYLTEG
ncbi:hypothetical protein [Nostoc sp. KVJ3]|uniref:hypothetical protein n=1 Tax=Nostoc sp. KVJ3 TaxID=457945 RepID=UPI002238B187|nr:hypothetical protein [Nostoc sp. KVJ3]